MCNSNTKYMYCMLETTLPYQIGIFPTRVHMQLALVFYVHHLSIVK